jgi:N-acetylmuramic acid 6-phosphate etherase
VFLTGGAASVLPVEGDPARFDALSTEATRPELVDFDLWTTLDGVRVFADDQLSVVAAMREAAASIAVAVDAIADKMSAGGRLIYVGAGTGGRMAAVDAAEIGPSYGLAGRVVAVLAGGLKSFTEGREYYEDLASAGAADVDALEPSQNDVVFGVSASGCTPYVLGGIAAGSKAGALTIGFACTVRSELGAVSDLAIEVSTGAEIIAGSTRLKAGTAQKCVLNAISTLVMVKLGRTYGNLMIDAVADNAKLRRRALRVVVQATGVDDARAAAVLEEAGGDAKVAVVALLAGVSTKRAEEVLRAAAGQVRSAVSLADARG